MPFDASYQAPPPVTPVMTPQESQAKALTLRNAIQQSQFAQQNQRQALAEGEQRLDEGARRIAGEKALDSAMAAGITPGAKKADGTQGPATYNEDAITQHLIDSGMGHLIPGVKKQMTEMDEAAAKASKAKTEAATAQDDYAAQGLMTIHDNKWDPGHAVGTLAHMSANGLPRAEAADLIAQIVANPTPENVKAIIEPHITQSRAAQNLLDSRATAGAAQTAADARKRDADVVREKQDNEAGGQIADSNHKQAVDLAPQLEAALNKGGPDAVNKILGRTPRDVAAFFDGKSKPGEFLAAALNPEQATAAAATAKRDAKAAQPKTAAELAMVATDPSKSPGDRQAANDALKRLDQYSQGTKTVVNLNQGGVTPDDYARAGEQYMRTGVMPPLGMSSGGRMQVLHAGNEWARSQGLSPGDIVTLQAANSGNKKSLEKFQGQRDQIVSFESTATKNIDQFLDLASKIPDTGSPWINTPLRLLNDKMVGSANIAAVNAARAVATNEIAKVTSGGSMSGVLSDSARQEVKDYNPQNATYAQTVAVVKVLKKDMANRHESMDQSLADIKSRFGGNAAPAGGAAAPNATKRFNPATGQIEAIKP